MLRFSTIFKFLLIVGVPLVVGLITYRFMHLAFLAPLDSSSKKEVAVEIPPGLTFQQICKLLEDKEVIRYGSTLNIIARLKGVDTKIKTGEYILSPALPPKAILQKLVDGEVFQRAVTIPEGTSIWNIGVELEKVGLTKRDEFDKILTDPKLLAQAGIASSSFEGYLFPDTYHFSRPITARKIAWAMLENGEKHWPPEFSEQAEVLGMSRHEILILASIIEKESSGTDEQHIISSVFHNRLNQGMKLQADPTVIYGIPNFNGTLTKKDLETPHPYNTYTNFGLPPGPIGNPGESSTRAALFPQKTSYLFFVADGTGRHVFSTTLQEHNEAVRKYRALLRQNSKDSTEGE